MNILFFVNHLLGIGHLKRISMLAATLKPDHKILILSGGMPVPGLDDNIIQLPPLKSLDAHFSTLVTDQGLAPDPNYLQARLDLITRTVHEFQPHCVITEHYPFGRKSLKQDFECVINTAKNLPQRPKIGISVRDILVSSARNRMAPPHFDFILVHGDAQVKSLWHQNLPTYFTGYIHETNQQSTTDLTGKIVVMAGGRHINEKLMQTINNVAARPPFKDIHWLIRGPQTENPLPNCSYRDFIPNIAHGLSQVKLLITEAGYNSFLDAYHSKVPTIFIPFHTEQEDEQMTRLTLLQAHHWSQILKPDELTPDTLSHSIDQALNQQHHYPMIDLNGLENTRKILNEYLATD